jgi:putative peptidoglycan lipid II flippase
LPKEFQKLRPLKRFLAVAAIWHVAVVLSVFLVSRAQLAPQTFDRNGIGLSFAIDSHNYRIEAQEMANLIRQGRIRHWTAYKASFHVKLYSLSFALAGGLVGPNILAAEPLNLFYYLLILALSYCITWEAFDQNVAVLAGGVIGLWPSLLLHTTQLLRDALFIPSMLLLALALLLIVNRNLSLKQGLLVAIPGTLGALIVWLCRGDSWEIVLAILILGAAICVLIQVKERRFSVGGTLAIALILFLTICIPRLVPTYRQSNISLESTRRQAELDGNTSLPKENAEQSRPSWNVARRVALLRHKFILKYPLAGSNIDTEVELQSGMDVVRYLPRAALIGFFAPFPNMWLTSGAQVGLSGRLIAGVEMLVLYVVIGLAVLTLVKEYRRLSVWLLFGISSAGCIALGYVVVNISTLYRMRYAYFILIIILGMKGLLYVMPVKFEAKAELSGSQALE